jgi:hypothetical protein
MGDPPQSFIVTTLLYVFVSVSQISRGIYLAYGIEPPPGYDLIRLVGIIWILGWWLRQDLVKHKVGWPLDLGMFLQIGWPAVVPYYLFRTRGVRAFIPIGIFVTMYFAPLVIGAAIYVGRMMR